MRLAIEVRDEDCASWLRILAQKNHRDVRKEACHLLEVKLHEEAVRLRLVEPPEEPDPSETRAA